MSDPGDTFTAAAGANRNTFWAAAFVDELHRGGVRAACVSPGSRSGPLTFALAAHSGIALYNHIDERSSSFFALGHAKAAGRPVALLSTSGTAAANFHPAVIEAFHARVPLIVLTADRPPELRGVGAGQTIDQIKLYGGAVKWFQEAGTPEMTDSSLRQLRAWAARAVFEAARPPAGAVHLNFPFRKPLEPTPVPGDVPPELLRAFRGAAGSAAPYSRGIAPPTAPDANCVERIAAQVRERPRGLIVCGPMAPVYAPGTEGNGTPAGRSEEAPFSLAVTALARCTGYPILAEPPSQVSAGDREIGRPIAHGEAILRAETFRRSLEPQLMLRFGGFPTAKHVEVLLDEHPDCPVVLVDPGGSWREPTHHPTTLVAADEVAFCGALAEALGATPPREPPRESAWLERFRAASRAAGEAIAQQFAEPPPAGLDGEWFEGRVFWELAGLLPSGALQYTASSMPVRDLDAFTPLTERRVRHLVNRGANGIDGTLSSALGAAAAHGAAGPAVLVTGDLAFYHDANGLLAAKQHGLALTVILLNNDGGGIFEMLPVAGFDPPFEEHFATPHGIDFAALCAAYGVALSRPTDWADFRRLVRQSLNSGETRVIEIRTDRKANRDLHRRIWEATAARLQEI
ncbi:MAG: 2-succinyl-5-enolpyruvyl-6-hydroxy-3-cyclohexene-1-carboxylic-acid synthase [SAR324 cluster bacterium]|nr:2-succinyl-5-enolpyruvyl-6-hydroxy-3-cyclohexene-1-carboxylic-acid synthase [SAR324 cluster bacterium]